MIDGFRSCELRGGSRGRGLRPRIMARISISYSLHRGYDDLKILHSRFASRCVKDADGGKLETTDGAQPLSEASDNSIRVGIDDLSNVLQTQPTIQQNCLPSHVIRGIRRKIEREQTRLSQIPRTAERYIGLCSLGRPTDTVITVRNRIGKQARRDAINLDAIWRPLESLCSREAC